MSYSYVSRPDGKLHIKNGSHPGVLCGALRVEGRGYPLITYEEGYVPATGDVCLRCLDVVRGWSAILAAKVQEAVTTTPVLGERFDVNHLERMVIDKLKHEGCDCTPTLVTNVEDQGDKFFTDTVVQHEESCSWVLHTEL